VPVPRRFDRRPPERDPTRINERIRVPEVRLIGDDGAQIGVIKTEEALRIARDRDLDLVEVAPEARPPVCRVLDYSKYKYEQEQKQKQARKHQQQITVREIKFRPKIAQHDYDTKKGHVERFLRHQDKVKVTIMFRGREVTHPERGEMILTRLADELAELAVVEQRPIQDGRNMTMVLAPHRNKPKGVKDDRTSTEPVEQPADRLEPICRDQPSGYRLPQGLLDLRGQESGDPGQVGGEEGPVAPQGVEDILRSPTSGLLRRSIAAGRLEQPAEILADGQGDRSRS